MYGGTDTRLHISLLYPVHLYNRAFINLRCSQDDAYVFVQQVHASLQHQAVQWYTWPVTQLLSVQLRYYTTGPGKDEGIQEGDVLVSNNPQLAGGSHLPDITVITPVFSQGKIVFFVASRGHHQVRPCPTKLYTCKNVKPKQLFCNTLSIALTHAKADLICRTIHHSMMFSACSLFIVLACRNGLAQLLAFCAYTCE